MSASPDFGDARRGTPGEAPSDTPWHMLSAHECLRRLGVDPASGLGADAAAERLARDGPNSIAESTRRPLWRMALGQFRDFMILVLIAAAIVSGVVGDPQDSIAIIVIILINAAIGVPRARSASVTVRPSVESLAGLAKSTRMIWSPAPNLPAPRSEPAGPMPNARITIQPTTNTTKAATATAPPIHVRRHET